MRVVNPSFRILAQGRGIEGIYAIIERAGRTCYKSEDKIGKGTAKAFVERMVASRHYAMLEHGTVYLKMFCSSPKTSKYYSNSYSRIYVPADKFAYITTNYRVLVENDWLDDLDYLCEPTEYHEKRVCVLFQTQIAVSREFNRHRVNSIAESSTRYCNYSKDKFGSENTINVPQWVQDELPIKIEGYGHLGTMCTLIANGEESCMKAVDWWYFANKAAELAYMNLIRLGKKPQEARAVLPLDTNTDLVHTAYISDWKHFFDLRALDKTGPAHPDAKALALPLYEVFKYEGYIR